MKHLGLFEGIGGFSLAARWMGWETIAWCEINPFCQQVLKHHFPNAAPHSDIITTDFTVYRGMVDILTGGFPCQPYSTAGKRLGKEDERHLWPHMLRAIREVQPRWVVGENVRGLTNWNGGLVFDEVQSDLEAEGFEVTPFLLPACAVDAPHRRDRIWFVAHACCIELPNERATTNVHRGEAEVDQRSWGELRNYTAADGAESSTADALKLALPDNWHQFPLQPPILSRDDGIPRQLDALSFSQYRVESLKGAGNAIVPQIAHQIFQAIQEYESIIHQ